MEHFRLPLHFRELVSVAERFEVSPILPLFTAGGTFYLLAISRNHVRFFRGTPDALAQLDIGNIPRSVDEALKYDVRESQLQVHSGAGGSAAGKEGAVFTGQGAMPRAFESEAALLQFVASTPGALGYVNRVVPGDKVKPLSVLPPPH